MTNQRKETTDDTLVGVPDHPAASVAGAVLGGAATGAVAGTAAGPVGTAVGVVVGAVIGGLGGDAVASSIEQVQDSPGRAETHTHDRLGAARQFGEQARLRYPNRDFDEVEPALAAEWMQLSAAATLSWNEAREAVRAAFE